jgi:hypothetical protein
VPLQQCLERHEHGALVVDDQDAMVPSSHVSRSALPVLHAARQLDVGRPGSLGRWAGSPPADSG